MTDNQDFTAIHFTEMPSDRDWVLARRGVVRRFIRNGCESAADTFPTLEPESTLRAEIEALRAVVRRCNHPMIFTHGDGWADIFPTEQADAVRRALGATSGSPDFIEPRAPMADECIEPGDVKCPHTQVCPECWDPEPNGS